VRILKKIEKYFSKHIYLNWLAGLIVGAGIGVLITDSFINPHPVRYGIGLIAIGLLFCVWGYYKG
jgi:F0F1-type ATP synthase assembly protein I